MKKEKLLGIVLLYLGIVMGVPIFLLVKTAIEVGLWLVLLTILILLIIFCIMGFTIYEGYTKLKIGN